VIAFREESVFLFRIAAALLLAVSASLAHAQASAKLIFSVGSTSFASSHASTIVELKNGDLLSAWFGGSAEGKPDVAIWAARRTAKGWSAPIELAREPQVACWNPVLFHTRDGRLWLYYKFGPSPSDWVAARRYSRDEGLTWSTAEHLPAGVLGPIRAKPLILEDGTIVSGTSFEAYHSWSIWIERSTDDGKTWTKIGPILPAANVDGKGAPDAANTQGLIQPSVVRLGKGHLRLYARSTAEVARVCFSDSFDNGLTWTSVHPLDVPNPNSGIDAVTLRDGRVVLIYNDTTSGRSPLNLAVSRDGKHFQNFYTLEAKPGEYSYPAIIQSAKGDLEMTYTWNRKTIEYVHFPLKDIQQ
jgi:predicted neuraminidase